MGYYYFSPILTAPSVIIYYGINPFDICEKNPDLWHIIKLLFTLSYIFSSLIISNVLYQDILVPMFSRFNNFIYSKISPKLKNFDNSSNNKSNIELSHKNVISLYVGTILNTNEEIYLPEKSLYQNILITGTIGTGKTSSAMYPFTEQLIANKMRLPMLILDVKGNYYLHVQKLCKKYNREADLIVLELNGKYKYNPLHKPNLKPSVLADRLRDILLLFSPNNSESYWIDKVHQLLTETIKLCRLYNNGYVSFDEIHKLITQEGYYKEKIPILRKKFKQNAFCLPEIHDLYSALNFLEKEFFSLDLRTISILKSEVTRITNCFISDYSVFRTFCPDLSELNFTGFEDVLSSR